MEFNTPTFKNQGQCVSYVRHMENDDRHEEKEQETHNENHQDDTHGKSEDHRKDDKRRD